ncbi:MAG: ABC transporter permease [Ruminococcaceae bacterium]|nr:ABC transporter permease [Oscillospiraceae bacterium]
MKTFSRIYMIIVFLFLYAPIIVMAVFSFNGINSTGLMEGFSFRWYAELFDNDEVLSALKNTLILAVLSSIISTILGTAAAVGINSMRNGWLKGSTMMLTNIPMMNPDIVTGISMMLLFVFVGRMVAGNGMLGFGSLLVAHITFNLPYVVLSILPKLRQMDPKLTEAALDLGCTPLQAFTKVVFPFIAPGVLTGMMMAFTLSLDDFVISYFVNGSNFQTLPILIYSMTKKRVRPSINALSTIIFVVVLVLLVVINLLQSRSEKRERENKKF